MPNDDFNKYYPPTVPVSPGEELGEEEQPEEQPKKPKWQWIGSSNRPEAEEGDGISDLFKVGFSNEMEDARDATRFDAEHDALDTDEDGSFDSLFEVTEDDIMGDELPPEPEPMKYRITKRGRNFRIVRPQPPESGMRGLRT